jgi:hypothetical protein
MAIARAAATSLADSDDEVPIYFQYIQRGTALLSCYGDAEALLPRPSVSRLSSSTSPPIVRPQPAPQAGGRGTFGYG